MRPFFFYHDIFLVMTSIGFKLIVEIILCDVRLRLFKF